MNTTGTGTGLLGGARRAEANTMTGTGAGLGTGSTTGAGVGTGTHGGPIRALETAAVGNTTAGAGGVPATGGGRHTASTGFGTGGTTTGTAGAVGTGAAPIAAATGRPPVGQRLIGEVEKAAGHIAGNPNMVIRGQEKKTGMPANVQNTAGVGNSNAAAGPGATTY